MHGGRGGGEGGRTEEKRSGVSPPSCAPIHPSMCIQTDAHRMVQIGGVENVTPFQFTLYCLEINPHSMGQCMGALEGGGQHLILSRGGECVRGGMEVIGGQVVERARECFILVSETISQGIIQEELDRESMD